MNRAVLDTNILVSAGITAGGNCDRVVQMALKKELGLVVSPGILGEYWDVLHRSRFTRYGFPPSWFRRLLALAECLAADPLELPDLPDPDDRLFLGVARHTGLLITGNIKHFPPGRRGEVQVLTHEAFLHQ